MKYEVKCRNCGHQWQSEFDDLNEWCPECFGDDIYLGKQTVKDLISEREWAG